MTEKQEKILEVAMRLFASQGYESSSTNQIAREAGVSEGLIFKHFENKEGLLEAILEEGQKRIMAHIDKVQQAPNAKSLINTLLDLTVQLIREEREFWALQFTLKYKSQHFAKLKKQSEYQLIIYQSAANAFKELGYAQPEREAELLLVLIEGLSSILVSQGESEAIQQTIQFIQSKYQ